MDRGLPKYKKDGDKDAKKLKVNEVRNRTV